MPDGKTHRKMTLGLAGAGLPALLLGAPGLAYLVGVLAGLIVEPDLDVNRWTASERLLYRTWPPLGWAWRAFWYPYALAAAHRGLSHAPLLGTALRAAYLLAIPLVLASCWRWSLPWALLGAWFAGLCAADLLHIISDRLVTTIRRL